MRAFFTEHHVMCLIITMGQCTRLKRNGYSRREIPGFQRPIWHTHTESDCKVDGPHRKEHTDRTCDRIVFFGMKVKEDEVGSSATLEEYLNL